MKNLRPESPIVVGLNKDITRFIPNQRISISKSFNPEKTPIKSEMYLHKEKEDYIKSPFQKDQFLRTNLPAKGNFIKEMIRSQKMQNKNVKSYTQQQLTNSPQVIRLQEIKNKSDVNIFSSMDMRQNIAYLEQIISDLSDKREFSLTRRYLLKIPSSNIRQKIQNIANKLQSKQEIGLKQIKNNLANILKNHFKYDKSIENLPVDNLTKELEKSIQKIVDGRDKNRREESKERIKQMKQESKVMNSKLQKETRQFHKLFEQQKIKMKESYEDIYRKIYEENNRLKRENQVKAKALEQEKKTSVVLKGKYQKILTEVSHQLKEIKFQYSKLNEISSSHQKVGNDLKEEIGFMRQKLEIQESKVKELDLIIKKQRKSISLLQEQNSKLQILAGKYKQYAQKFLEQTKKYQAQKIERQKKIDEQLIIQDVAMQQNHQQQIGHLQKLEQLVQVQQKEHQRYIGQLKASISRNEELIHQQSNSLQQLQFKFQDQQQKLEELNIHIEANLKVEQELNQILIRLFNQKQKLQSDVLKLQATKLQVFQQKAKQEGQFQSLERTISQKVDSARSELNDLKKLYQEQQQKMGQLRDQLASQSEKYSNLKQKQQVSEQKYYQTNLQISSQKTLLAQIQNQISQRQRSNQQLQRETKIIYEEIMQKKERLLILNQNIELKVEQMQNLSNKFELTYKQKQVQIDELQCAYEQSRRKMIAIDNQACNLAKMVGNLEEKEGRITKNIADKQAELQKIVNQIGLYLDQQTNRQKQISNSSKQVNQTDGQDNKLSHQFTLIAQNEQHLRQLSQSKQIKAQELKNMTDLIQKLKTQVEQNMETLEQQNSQMQQNTQLVANIQERKLQLQRLETQIIRKTQQQDQLSYNYRQTICRTTELLGRLEDIAAQKESADRELKQSQSTIQDRQQDLKALLRSVESQRIKFQNLRERSSQIQAMILIKEKVVGNLQNKVDEKQALIRSHQDRLLRLGSSEPNYALLQNQTQNRIQKSSLDKADSQFKRMTSAIEQLSMAKQQLIGEINRLELELSGLRSNISQKYQQLVMLESDIQLKRSTCR